MWRVSLIGQWYCTYLTQMTSGKKGISRTSAILSAIPFYTPQQYTYSKHVYYPYSFDLQNIPHLGRRHL